ncbi:Sec-independent protein translocase protein TatB [Brevundimonas sp.]|uniref:Sec-independent protein translocase protein TatB n=1 Tax=Brevundimonas sp. TaxID=1871086 RepID=UPI0028997251|nr:Sec-independent protein translocase protein TatB [Brevundimonas sp.]
MGGLGPGIGGFEILVIGIVALLVVGPKDLPLLMRRVGQFVGKARAMANEFRASFDEMARQSELDELRKEVQALRKDSGMYALGKDADDAFKDIRKELESPLDAAADKPKVSDVAAASATTAVAANVAQAEPVTPAVSEPQIVPTGVDEWPDLDAQAAQVEAAEAEATKKDAQ